MHNYVFFGREYFNCIVLSPVTLKCIVYMYIYGCVYMHVMCLGWERGLKERDQERRKGEVEPHGMYICSCLSIFFISPSLI